MPSKSWGCGKKLLQPVTIVVGGLHTTLNLITQGVSLWCMADPYGTDILFFLLANPIPEGWKEWGSRLPEMEAAPKSVVFWKHDWS